MTSPRSGGAGLTWGGVFLLTALLFASVPPLGVWAVAVRGETRCPSASDVSDPVRGPGLAPDVASRDRLAGVAGCPDPWTGPRGSGNPAGAVRRRPAGGGAAHPAGVVLRRNGGRRGGGRGELGGPVPHVSGGTSLVAGIGRTRGDRQAAPPAAPPATAGPAVLAVARVPALGGGRPGAARRFAVGASAGVVTTPGAGGAESVEGGAGFLQIDGELLVRSRWLLRLTAAVTGLREQPLGEGRIAWRRGLLFPSLGWAWRGFGWRSAPLFADIGAGPAAALIDAQAEGFLPERARHQPGHRIRFRRAVRGGIGPPARRGLGGRDRPLVVSPPSGRGGRSVARRRLNSSAAAAVLCRVGTLSVMGGLTFLFPQLKQMPAGRHERSLDMSLSPLRRLPADAPEDIAFVRRDVPCLLQPESPAGRNVSGGPGLDHDETVQEVFLIVARRLHEFRGDAKVTTWLFRITTRVVANQRRAAQRRRTWSRLTRRIEDHTATDDPGPAAGLERMEANRRFYRALDALPERYRQVLVLFELEELGTDEIARLVERPPATVRVWLHRGRAAFIDAWLRHQKEHEA